MDEMLKSTEKTQAGVMKYVVLIAVIMPDGSIADLPVCRFRLGAVDGKNGPVRAEFATKKDARDWQQHRLLDRARVVTELTP